MDSLTRNILQWRDIKAQGNGMICLKTHWLAKEQEWAWKHSNSWPGSSLRIHNDTASDITVDLGSYSDILIHKFTCLLLSASSKRPLTARSTFVQWSRPCTGLQAKVLCPFTSPLHCIRSHCFSLWQFLFLCCLVFWIFPPRCSYGSF